MSSIKSTQTTTIQGTDGTLTTSLLGLNSTKATQLAGILGQIPDDGDVICCVALYVKVIGYTGPLYNVRRDSDAATSDIYSLEEAQEFLGSDQGTIVTWYDQSGNGNDFTNATSSTQPILQFSETTTLLPILQFSTTRLLTGSLSVSAGDFTVVYHFVPTDIGGAGARCIASDSVNWLMGPYSSVVNMYAGGFAGGGYGCSNGDSIIHTGYKTAAGNNLQRVNGVATGGSAGSAYPAQFNLGRDNIFGEAANSSISEVVILNVATEDRMSAIEASMSSRYTLLTA